MLIGRITTRVLIILGLVGLRQVMSIQNQRPVPRNNFSSPLYICYIICQDHRIKIRMEEDNQFEIGSIFFGCSH